MIFISRKGLKCALAGCLLHLAKANCPLHSSKQTYTERQNCNGLGTTCLQFDNGCVYAYLAFATNPRAVLVSLKTSRMFASQLKRCIAKEADVEIPESFILKVVLDGDEGTVLTDLTGTLDQHVSGSKVVSLEVEDPSHPLTPSVQGYTVDLVVSHVGEMATVQMEVDANTTVEDIMDAIIEKFVTSTITKEALTLGTGFQSGYMRLTKHNSDEHKSDEYWSSGTLADYVGRQHSILYLYCSRCRDTRTPDADGCRYKRIWLRNNRPRSKVTSLYTAPMSFTPHLREYDPNGLGRRRLQDRLLEGEGN